MRDRSRRETCGRSRRDASLRTHPSQPCRKQPLDYRARRGASAPACAWQNRERGGGQANGCRREPHSGSRGTTRSDRCMFDDRIEYGPASVVASAHNSRPARPLKLGSRDVAPSRASRRHVDGKREVAAARWRKEEREEGYFGGCSCALRRRAGSPRGAVVRSAKLGRWRIAKATSIHYGSLCLWHPTQARRAMAAENAASALRDRPRLWRPNPIHVVAEPLEHPQLRTLLWKCVAASRFLWNGNSVERGRVAFWCG
jgi:hypothetical protein